MLRAILEGKAGRVSLDDNIHQSWRDVFRVREDLLTAVFFSRLEYLNDESSRSVLEILLGAIVVTELEPIKRVTFWPQLKGLAGRSFVEPDVIIDCGSAYLLVEVKPPFGGDQQIEQWRNEIESLIIQQKNSQSEWEEEHTIHLIALGRNSINWRNHAIALEREFENHDIHIHAVEWDQVYEGIHKLFEVAKGKEVFIFRDWLDAFSLFGMVEKPLPFEDLLKQPFDCSLDLITKFTLNVDRAKKISSIDTDWESINTYITNHQLDIQKWH